MTMLRRPATKPVLAARKSNLQRTSVFTRPSFLTPNVTRLYPVRLRLARGHAAAEYTRTTAPRAR